MAGHQVQLYSRDSGFWIECGDPPRCHTIQEHLLAVEADPERFGLTADFLAKQREMHTDREAYRAVVLAAAMRNGFVRVRGHRNYTTFQFDRAPESHVVTRAILWFCSHVHMADVEWIVIANLADGLRSAMTLGAFRDAEANAGAGGV